MRKIFGKLLKEQMLVNESIILVTADLGFGILDECKKLFSDRFYNTGAAEQLMIGLGIGLAENNKIPICYSITPFLLYRPFELIRNYINYENIPVKLVGSGRNKDYSHDGISHWADDDEHIIGCLPNIQVYKPKTEIDLVEILPEFLYNNKPSYLNLAR